MLFQWGFRARYRHLPPCYAEAGAARAGSLRGTLPVNRPVGEELRRNLVWLHLLLLQRVSAQPISLRYWRGVRRLAQWLSRVSDPLVPPLNRLISTSERLQCERLRRPLADAILGSWSLNPPTLDRLWLRLSAKTPRTLLEFGSGVTTRVFAMWAADDADRRVLSLEQDAAQAAALRSALKESGMAGQTQVIHAPVGPDGSYCIDLHSLSTAAGSQAFDFVFIDGPAGPPGCRLNTLPRVTPLCSDGAVWLLDDAFRDGELEILDAWSLVRGLTVDGIIACGTGLAVGTVGSTVRQPRVAPGRGSTPPRGISRHHRPHDEPRGHPPCSS